VLNETFNINFIPILSSQSAGVAGGTVGLGAAHGALFVSGDD
jgi:hypothetical protein